MCSIHVRAIELIKINLCFVRMSKCDLFNCKHNGMASIRIAQLLI